MIEQEPLTCEDYGINGTANASDLALDYSLAPLPKLIAGTLVFFLVLPFVLFEFRFFPIGTTSAVLLGAILMVLAQVVSQEEVYEVLGHRENLTTIFLLLGMMLLAQYFEREQLLVKLLRRVLKPNHTFPNYLWRVSLLSFILSAFFTNDACCAILTPLLMKFWEAQERPHTEIETLLLAIATSSNIGSVTTIFGNPQMALIASRTNTRLFVDSKIDMRYCLTYLGLPALVVFGLNILFLIAHHRIRTRNIEKSKLISEPSQSEQEMAGLTGPAGHHANEMKPHSNGNVQLRFDREDILYDCIDNSRGDITQPPCQLETIPEDEVLEIETATDRVRQDSTASDVNTYEERSSSDEEDESPQRESTSERLNVLVSVDYKPSALQSQNTGLNEQESPQHEESHGLKLSERAGIYRSLSAFSVVEFLSTEPLGSGGGPGRSVSYEALFSASESLPFHIIISILLVLILILFLASTHVVTFDMGLTPMCAAILVITVDAIINHQNANIIMKRVDWSILMLFFGIFVWMHGLNATRLPRWTWAKMGLAQTSGHLSPLYISILTVFVMFGSNIFSNVPLTLIVLEQLVPCQNQRPLLLYTAWSATIAGNLTLFGSVANLIVAQKGQQTVNFRLTFWAHIRFCFGTTIINVVLGLMIIYALLLI